MKELGLGGKRSETTIPESSDFESKRLAKSFVEDRDEVGRCGAIRGEKKRRIRRRPLAKAHGISGSKRDPIRGNIEEIPFSSKMRVNPDRFPDPRVFGSAAQLQVDPTEDEV